MGILWDPLVPADIGERFVVLLEHTICDLYGDLSRISKATTDWVLSVMGDRSDLGRTTESVYCRS